MMKKRDLSTPLAKTFGDDDPKMIKVKSDVTKKQASGFAKLTRLQNPNTGTLYSTKDVQKMAKDQYGLDMSEQAVKEARRYYMNQPVPKKYRKK